MRYLQKAKREKLEGEGLMNTASDPLVEEIISTR